MKKTGFILAAILAAALTGCGTEQTGQAQTEAATETAETESGQVQEEKETKEKGPALTVDKDAKTITVKAEATGNTDSSIHLLVNQDGSNAEHAFFTTEATSMDFYNALVELGAVPGNNIPVDAADGTILGSGMDVSVSAEGQDCGVYDMIEASEKREMDMRFGGNIALNQEYGTGCLLCLESCSVGVASDAAYEYNEKIEFVPSEQMPEKGTEAVFTLAVDDTAMVVDKENSRISMNAVSTGYAESTIHAVVNEDGANADKTLFTTKALTGDFYRALKELGAEDGNNIALDDADGTIEGTSLDVAAEIGTKTGSFAELFTDSGDREMDIRFGGNLEVNQEYATGCIMCLESCPAGITSNAAYQYKEEAVFGPSRQMPEAGKHIIVTFTVKK